MPQSNILSFGGQPAPREQPEPITTPATPSQPSLGPQSNSRQHDHGYYIKPRADVRFNVCNQSGTVTTRSTIEKAQQCIADLIVAAKSPPTEQSTAQPEPRRSSRNHCPNLLPQPKAAATKRRGRKSGDAWHGKRKEPEATSAADAIDEYLAAHSPMKKTKLGRLAANCADSYHDLR